MYGLQACGRRTNGTVTPGGDGVGALHLSYLVIRGRGSSLLNLYSLKSQEQGSPGCRDKLLTL